jgi:hypothetical protein
VSISKGSIGKFRNRTGGIVIDCEGGYFVGDASGGALFDKQGKKIKDIPDDGSEKKLETSHLSNFLGAVRDRKAGELVAEVLEGHRSTACCHMANISHRLGKQSSPEAIQAAVSEDRELADAFDRCREYLRENGVDLGGTPATLGPWVTFDPKQERFVKNFATEANALSHRDYRQPYVVPKIT